MARQRLALPDIGPWRRQPLVIPPDSLHAWLRLAVWEAWMGIVLCGALSVGIHLITTTRTLIGTPLYVLFNAWCGLLMIVLAAWLLWELWSATAPKPITDDFLKLLDDSFGYDWRRLRTWPWARLAWAYGFTLAGAALALLVALIL